jgi:mono/diheme cytochrome c family protein
MKMMNRHKKAGTTLAVAAVLVLASCTDDPNSPGLEYMPDMYRSPAIEAYVDYDNPGVQSARKPVEGTIEFASEEEAKFHLPYPYPSNSEGYQAAGEELKSPLPTKKEYIDEGKEIFTTFCIQCHGEKGEGDGSITMKAGGKYPVVPSYQSRAGLADGKMYHTLTYGKGLMGSHASQLSQKERWIVIQYVRTLMSGETPEFDENGFAIDENSASAANENGADTASKESE